MKKIISAFIIYSISISCVTTYELKPKKEIKEPHKELIIESKKIKNKDKLSGLGLTSIMLSGITFGLYQLFTILKKIIKLQSIHVITTC